MIKIAPNLSHVPLRDKETRCHSGGHMTMKVVTSELKKERYTCDGPGCEVEGFVMMKYKLHLLYYGSAYPERYAREVAVHFCSNDCFAAWAGEVAVLDRLMGMIEG